jgi:aspartyl/asparaginyl beta-hydroxylase (cupin superfamily)
MRLDVDDARSLFPFLAHLEAHAAIIREEALCLEERDFVQMPHYDRGWTAFLLDAGMWEHEFPGVDFAANRLRCPRTYEAVSAIEGLLVTGILRLAPGAVIAPHTDRSDDDVIRAHLGLVLPEREHAWWREGTARLMDVRKLHGARNDSDAPRLTLVVDVRMRVPFDRAAIAPWTPA